MEVRFLGVGEACDENFPNTSILIIDKGMVLLDVGFSAAHMFFKFIKDPDLLDAVWISHFHGDHFFGVPLIILRFWEMGRRKPLYFIGQKGIREKVETVMDLAYPYFKEKLKYEMLFLELEPLQPQKAVGFCFTGCYSDHSQKNMALRLEASTGNVYYSGDGRPNSDCMSLAMGCDMIIHECFLVKGEIEGHGNVEMSIEFAINTGVNKLAVVHMQRDERKRFNISSVDTKGIDLFMPLPGDLIKIS